VNELLLISALLCSAGLAAGLTAGLFGNGGGFVVVPALLAVFPFIHDMGDNLMPLAIGTSLASIVVSSARALYAHARRGAVDFAVVRSWSAWIVAGVLCGLYLASVVESRILISLFGGGVLLYSVYFLFHEQFHRYQGRWNMPTGAARAALASGLGGFSSLLGIGGGTVTVLTMVLCNRPVHQAVATAAGVGLIIGLTGALGFLLMGLNAASLPPGAVGFIHVPALIAIAAFSLLTAPLGVRWAHQLDPSQLKRVFGLYLVAVSIAMFLKA
jgi:uncharacterized membrane protein YfcA